MRVDQKQLLAGLIFGAIGAASVVLARRLELGTTTRVGPGGFPMLIGSVLAILGAVNVTVSLAKGVGEGFGPGEGKAALLIPLSVVVFALTIDIAGLVPAIVAAVLIAGLATPTVRVGEVLLLAGGLAVAGALIFVYGLGLSFDLFIRP